jgi:uncharacterized protein
VSRLGELTAKVDAFFARVEARHGDDMQCRTGCSDCCHVRLTVTSVEAAAIRAEVGSWPAERRRTLMDVGPGDRCAALDGAGRCKIYAARPLVCRSQGAPIRFGAKSLPVLPACGHNFTHTQPDPDCVLDQETLSAILFAVDRHYASLRDAAHPGKAGACAAAGGGARIDLADLVAALAST